MLQSLFIYTSLFGVMMVFSLITHHRHRYSKSLGANQQNDSIWKIYIIFPLILFAIVFGMRYDVGTDHLDYLYGYKDKIKVSKGEPLFDLITNIFQGLNLHYAYYFTFIAFIQVFLFFYAFKNEKYIYPFLVFFLFTNHEWVFWMNGIRQALALCVWLVAVRYIAEKRVWTYLSLCVVSILFHYSSAILIILYPILSNSKDYFRSIKQQIILIVAAFAIQTYFVFLLPKAGEILNLYKLVIGGGKAYGKTYGVEGLLKSYIESKGTNLVYYSKILINIIVILYSKNLKDFFNNNYFKVIYSLFFIGLFTNYMIPVGFISVTRPFVYFYIFETVIYAFFAYYLIKVRTPQNQAMFIGMITLFIGIFFSAIIVASEESSFLFKFYFDFDN